MISIGWRNLRSDPLRLAVSVGGVVFAVTLVTVEVGMMLGITRNSSILVDRTKADLIVSSPNNMIFDFAAPISYRKKYQIESVEGVDVVEPFNTPMTFWRLPDGGNATCQLVSFDLDGDLAPNLKLVAGDIRDLHNQDTVIVDESGRNKLGYPKIGDCVELLDKRAKIVGFTRDMTSFSTIPFVFTSLRRGQKFSQISEGNQRKAIFFLVKIKAGYSRAFVQAQITKRVRDVAVHTKDGLSSRTRWFWMVETGIGLAFLGSAIMALIVGGVILSQTLFSLTMERISEFGVLKALGAGMPELSRVVLEQGLICGGSGLVLGILISVGLSRAAANAGTTVEIGWPLIMLVSFLTLILSCVASLISIAKLRGVEPASVFRA